MDDTRASGIIDCTAGQREHHSVPESGCAPARVTSKTIHCAVPTSLCRDVRKAESSRNVHNKKACSRREFARSEDRLIKVLDEKERFSGESLNEPNHQPLPWKRSKKRRMQARHVQRKSWTQLRKPKPAEGELYKNGIGESGE